jgi:putative membrane protein
MTRLLLGWAINAVCLVGVTHLLGGIYVSTFWTALVVVLVLGLMNTFIRPVLVLLTLPINLLTLGLFTLVINGLMFWIVANVVEGFAVASFGRAILAALLYGLISWLVSALLLGPRE